MYKHVYRVSIAACLLFMLVSCTIIDPNLVFRSLGDYGDAPDGDLGMDTGYYAFGGGPFVYSLRSAGVTASFPTFGADPIPGPFTQDVDDFYIGPLFGSFSTADVPSIEDDATDPTDPDGLPNLMGAGNRADCDRESSFHSPAGNGCAPLPPYSIPMNARLVVMLGSPPLGVLITSVIVSPNTELTGYAYWNLLIDLNQDGAWGSGEWIAQDVPVALTPGETITLVSPAFRLATSSPPWGRLNFPFWARSAVTLESVKDTFGTTTWDGRGPQGGFTHGEVEDYFIEWRPIGQVLPELAQQTITQCQPEDLPTIHCPEMPKTGGSIFCEYTGLEWGPLRIQCLPELGAAAFGDGLLTPQDPVATICQTDTSEAYVEFFPNGFNLTITKWQNSGTLLFYAEPPSESSCQGNPPAGLSLGFWEALEELELSASPMDLVGLWLFEAVVKGGNEAHHDWIKMLSGLRIKVDWRNITFGGETPWVNVSGTLNDDITFYSEDRGTVSEHPNIAITFEGNIVFEGEPPWVNVSGTLNDDGTFYAEGRGTVAGYPNIAVTFEGTISPTSLSGDYTMGAEGGLPGGQPIIYGITGTRPEDDTETPQQQAPLPEEVMANIEAFAQTFNLAFQDREVDTLLGLLHPAVFDLYGVEACQTYLAAVVDNPVQIEVLDAQRIGTWSWETDNQSIAIEFSYAVQINLTAEGQTNQTEFHLVLPGDDSVRWLTDCGDPLP